MRACRVVPPPERGVLFAHPPTVPKSVSRTFAVDTLNAERLVASYETGVLTLRIPVAEPAKPRNVQITEGADGRTIEAQTTEAGT